MSMPTDPKNSAEIPSPITQPGARSLHAVPTQTIVIQQPGAFSRFFSRLGWIAFGMAALMLLSLSTALSDYFNTSQGIKEKYHSGAQFGSDKIAIISIEGAILDGDGFVKKQIDRIRKDDKVKGVVVRIDSPGGTVSGSDYIFHHLKKLRQEKLAKLSKGDAKELDFPLIVSMGGTAASGGYYVAMAVGDQEKAIYAEPTTTTGSIGVIIPHYDLTGLMAELGVKDNSIATHPHKQILSMTKEMSPEEREILQAYINESFTRFKEIIKEGRPHFAKNEAELDQLATGEIFSANQAKKLGLIDEVGFLEDAIARARELAGLSEDKTRVIEYESPMGILDLGLAQARRSDSQLQTLVDLSTPRAYYMFTTLPPLLTSYAR